MKCISLWQPWATLLVCGRKKLETRHWTTSYTGPLLIHAAKRWTGEQMVLCARDPFYMSLLSSGYSGFHYRKTSLPLGAIVGAVELTNCLGVSADPVQRWLSQNPDEIHFGDYSHGRYAWACDIPHQLEEPIPEKGHQGFWDVPNYKLPKNLLSIFGEVKAQPFSSSIPHCTSPAPADRPETRLELP